MAKKIGFDAYAESKDMPDPIQNALNSILDHMHKVDSELEEIKKSGKDNSIQEKILVGKMNKYFNEGYPKDNGLIVSGILLRKHNEEDVKITMEKWWEELKYGNEENFSNRWHWNGW